MRDTTNELLLDYAEKNPRACAQFLDRLEPCVLEAGETLTTPGTPGAWTYFVERGVLSVVATTVAGQSVELAAVGREGACGVIDVLGNVPARHATRVQLRGTALRARADVIRTHLFSCTDLHELLMMNAQFLMAQLAQSAVCNRFHTAHERLARWLLYTANRAGTSELELTHEAVAEMVGSPRSAVTQAALDLRKQGVVEYRRGKLFILDAAGLEAAACECYRVLSANLRAVASATGS
jgi:CRP-like cAMP-binding protein